MQLKFSLLNDPLFKHEETRAWKINEKGKSSQHSDHSYKNPVYLVDLDFPNIKSLTYQTEPYRGSSYRPQQSFGGKSAGGSESGDAIFLSLMIQMATPCSARKKMQNQRMPTQSRSPFNMGLGELFLNNWNLNQTFIFKGRTTAQQLETFLAVVKDRSPGAKID